MTAQERVNEILSFGGKSQQQFCLNKLFKHTNYNDIMSFWKSLNATNKRLSKVLCADELVKMFFGETGDIEKRETEEVNISSAVLEEDFGFITLCDIQIPSDVILEIFSYFRYDKNLLFEVGRICKMFYISILTSWKHLTVNRKNIFKISILVLNSLRSVTFRESYGSAKNMFRNDEIDHILNNLNPKRIRTIKFETQLSSQLKILRHLYRKRKKLPNCLKFITRLEFSPYSPTYSLDFKEAGSEKPLFLKEIMPSLVEVDNPLKPRFIKGLELKSLKLDISYISGNGRLGHDLRKKEFDFKSIKIEGLKHLELSFGRQHYDDALRLRKEDKLFIDLINNSKNLEVLKIRRGDTCFGDAVFDLSALNNPNLQHLELFIVKEISKSSAFNFPSANSVRNGFWRNLHTLRICPHIYATKYTQMKSTWGVPISFFYEVIVIKSIRRLRIPILMDISGEKKNYDIDIMNDNIVDIYSIISSLEENLTRFEHVMIVFNWVVRHKWSTGNVKFVIELLTRNRRIGMVCPRTVITSLICTGGNVGKFSDFRFLETLVTTFLPKFTKNVLMDKNFRTQFLLGSEGFFEDSNDLYHAFVEKKDIDEEDDGMLFKNYESYEEFGKKKRLSHVTKVFFKELFLLNNLGVKILLYDLFNSRSESPRNYLLRNLFDILRIKE